MSSYLEAHEGVLVVASFTVALVEIVGGFPERVATLVLAVEFGLAVYLADVAKMVYGAQLPRTRGAVAVFAAFLVGGSVDYAHRAFSWIDPFALSAPLVLCVVVAIAANEARRRGARLNAEYFRKWTLTLARDPGVRVRSRRLFGHHFDDYDALPFWIMVAMLFPWSLGILGAAAIMTAISLAHAASIGLFVLCIGYVAARLLAGRSSPQMSAKERVMEAWSAARDRAPVIGALRACAHEYGPATVFVASYLSVLAGEGIAGSIADRPSAADLASLALDTGIPVLLLCYVCKLLLSLADPERWAVDRLALLILGLATTVLVLRPTPAGPTPPEPSTWWDLAPRAWGPVDGRLGSTFPDGLLAGVHPREAAAALLFASILIVWAVGAIRQRTVLLDDRRRFALALTIAIATSVLAAYERNANPYVAFMILFVASFGWKAAIGMFRAMGDSVARIVAASMQLALFLGILLPVVLFRLGYAHLALFSIAGGVLAYLYARPGIRWMRSREAAGLPADDDLLDAA